MDTARKLAEAAAYYDQEKLAIKAMGIWNDSFKLRVLAEAAGKFRVSQRGLRQALVERGESKHYWTQHELFKTQPDPDIDPILEDMRARIAKGHQFGVTLSGNRLTLRWTGADNRSVDAHMVILHVSDYTSPPTPEDEEMDK